MSETLTKLGKNFGKNFRKTLTMLQKNFTPDATSETGGQERSGDPTPINRMQTRKDSPHKKNHNRASPFVDVDRLVHETTNTDARSGFNMMLNHHSPRNVPIRKKIPTTTTTRDRQDQSRGPTATSSKRKVGSHRRRKRRKGRNRILTQQLQGPADQPP